MADLISLLCLCPLRGSPLHSAIILTLFTLVLRSGSIGEPWALCSEPDGVLEGDTDSLVGQPVSSIVDRHTDSNSQEQAAHGRQWTQAVNQSSRFSSGAIWQIAAFIMAHHFQKLYVERCSVVFALFVKEANFDEDKIWIDAFPVGACIIYTSKILFHTEFQRNFMIILYFF